jgi:GT2 family glycosyltransferase
MKMTVLIPTYRRPQDLERCLRALQQQNCPADEVLTIVRDPDNKTHAFLQAFNPVLPLRIVTVTATGVKRFDEDERKCFSAVATANAVHNAKFIVLSHSSLLRRFVYVCWSVIVGTCSAFGWVQLLRFLPKEGGLTLQKWQAAMQGRWQGWQTWNTFRSDRQESAS